MEVNSLLTPLIRAEISDLLRWIAFSPYPFLGNKINKSFVWHLTIDEEWDDSEIDDINRFMKNSELNVIQTVFHSLRLDPRESVYMRRLKRTEACELPYGSKSGPNKQFFDSIKRVLAYSSYSLQDSLLLLEVDAIPIRKGWLSLLNKALENKPDFLIAGSRYQGESKLSPRINKHFNGNAIYGIGHLSFEEFLKDWESLLKKAISEAHWIAYDICIEWIANSTNPAHLRIKQDYSSVLTNYTEGSVDMSEYIANVSGAHETSNDVFPIEAIKPSHLIIHSKPLCRRLEYLIARKSLKEADLSYKHPLNIKFHALANGSYEYFSSPHPNKFSGGIGKVLLDNHLHLKDPLISSMVRSCTRKPSTKQPIYK